VSRLARENLSGNLVVEDADPGLWARPVHKWLSCMPFAYGSLYIKLST
jgi:hypothetical protein